MTNMMLQALQVEQGGDLLLQDLDPMEQPFEQEEGGTPCDTRSCEEMQGQVGRVCSLGVRCCCSSRACVEWGQPVACLQTAASWAVWL